MRLFLTAPLILVAAACASHVAMAQPAPRAENPAVVTAATSNDASAPAATTGNEASADTAAKAETANDASVGAAVTGNKASAVTTAEAPAAATPAAATPAAATPATGSDPSAATAVASVSDKSAKDEGVICRRETVTGSHFPVRVCTTRKQREETRRASQDLLRDTLRQPTSTGPVQGQ